MRMILTAALLALPTGVIADAIEHAVTARQGYFTMLGANMGPLAAMAKGEMDYDEEVASTHASNIEALASYGVPMHFPEGSSLDDLGADVTEAKPEIWSDADGFATAFADFQTAAEGAGEKVKGGQQNVGAVLQGLGKTCKSCHDDYRQD